MNILFISPSSPRESVGGIERYITNLIDYCKNQPDLKIKILLPTLDKDSIEIDGNVTIYFSQDIATIQGMTALETSKMARVFADTVKKIIVDDKIDIICAENFHLGLPPAYSILLNMVCALCKIPVVLRVHSFATTDLQRELINQLMWNRISCVSISVAGDCFTKGADINTLSTEYLGVNTKNFNHEKKSLNIRKQFGLSEKNKIILTATRIMTGKTNLLAEKGVINLIESFSRISPRSPDLRLLIAVGRPPERLKVEFANALDKLRGYTMLRNVDKKTIIKVFELGQMPEVYRESDLFVLASENETFGQVFIESMACGLPVIGTKVGGIPEIISDNRNGFLVRPRDASSLAQKIEKLLNDDILRKKFIEAGIKTIQDKFTLEEQFSSFVEMLKSIIKEK